MGTPWHDPWGRYWAKVDVGTPWDCWTWTGALRTGYGVGTSMRSQRAPAHVQSYLAHYGPYDTRLEIAHRCGNRACVNPLHLYAATHSENELDKRLHGSGRYHNTHCVNGHPRTPEDTYIRPDGRGRQCRICGREQQRKAQA